MRPPPQSNLSKKIARNIECGGTYATYIFLGEELGQTSQISGGSGRHFLEYDAPSSPCISHDSMKFLREGERGRSIFPSIKFHSETELSSKPVNGNDHDGLSLPSSKIRLVLVAVDKRLGVKPVETMDRFPRETIAGQSKWSRDRNGSSWTYC